MSAGWLAIQCGRLVLSPMLPAISSDLGISDAQAGFAFATLANYDLAFYGLVAALLAAAGIVACVT
ncbi:MULTISPECIES: hypothetical protein [Halobacterium]|uniref:hypothetical protein n=1 Tax=Halobacterium TaxID=2239 RepID=UPI0012F9C0C0|nr:MULTISPECIES: hypothetical protein [Halobacterium]MCG1004473.1 hypothetical protein [Halobacterium noricense]